MLSFVSNTYSLLQVIFVALAVAYKDLPLYQYLVMVQNVNIYSYKKDANVISMGFLLAKIYCYIWTPYGYLGKGKLHYTKVVNF